MIEVVRLEAGWGWTLICPAGRILVYSHEAVPSPMEANALAKAWRAAFWALADEIDHRQARCV